MQLEPKPLFAEKMKKLLGNNKSYNKELIKACRIYPKITIQRDFSLQN